MGCEHGVAKIFLRAMTITNAIHSVTAPLLRPTWSECVPLNGETGSVDSVRTLPWSKVCV